MSDKKYIKGFSKYTQNQKLEVVSHAVEDRAAFMKEVLRLRHPDPDIQNLINSFSENTLSSFPFPFSVAPNFLINGKYYFVPMVIEESSVVAAASSAAGFWYGKGGFKAQIINLEKTGQVSFLWKQDPRLLRERFAVLKEKILRETYPFTRRMEERGGGIRDIQLKDLSHKLPQTYQLHFTFLTGDSMGANFINTVLEEAASLLRDFFNTGKKLFPVEIIMSILSNYSPDCRVKIEACTSVKELDQLSEGISGHDFARRFVSAVDIAKIDPSRAVTHNKGILNAVDAVIMATGNDYRAVEAGAHSYAARKGSYSSLSYADYSEGEFLHGLEMPMAIGSVGGLTRIHPLAKWSFEILGNPSAPDLMQIAASAGLAGNFSALKALVTSGIQKGHMKMHLENILNFLGANSGEKEKIRLALKDKTVSHYIVQELMHKIRTEK